MSQTQDSLWGTAAAACERLAAGLAPDGQPNYDDADHLCDALEALRQEPAPRPTAEFLRHAAAAAAAAASLAAARPIAVPTNAADLRGEINRWGTAGYTGLLLLRAVCHGCLQGLETKQAFSLASAFLVFTDGVPPALLCLWSALQQPAVRQSDLPTEALALAGRTCTAITQTLNITTRQLGRSARSGQPAAAGPAQPRPVDRLLRSTAARPAHIVAALDNLTTLMQLGSPYAVGSQEGRQAMHEWLELAAFVLTDKLCAEEQRRLEQQPELQQKVAALAVAVARERLQHVRAWCADPDSLQVWQLQLFEAAEVLTSGLLLPITAQQLAGLDGTTGGLEGNVPADLASVAVSSLEAALAEVAAGEPAAAAAAATRAMQLAAFAADALAAAGAAAGLGPAVGASQVSVVGRPSAELAELQLHLLRRSQALVPAALAAVDAALQHDMLGTRLGSEAPAAQTKAAKRSQLRVGRFLSWLGASCAQVEEEVVSQRPADAARSAAATWLLLTRRMLQLDAEHASGSDDAAPPHQCLHMFMCHLSEGSRGLAALHLQATLLAENSHHPDRAAAAAAGGSPGAAGAAGTALQPEAALAELPTLQQLATAVCILAHKAAAVGPQQDERSLRRLFCWDEGEPIAVALVEQLGSVVHGLNRVLEVSRSTLPASPGGSSAGGTRAADRQLGVTLLELTAAATALFSTIAALPAVAGAAVTGRPLSSDLSQALRSLVVSAQMVVVLAQAGGHEAVATESERLTGRVLKLSSDCGVDPRLLAASWMSVSILLRLPRPLGIELVATGAVDAAVGWLHTLLQSSSEDWQPVSLMAVLSGIATALLSAAQLLVPPREPGNTPASGTALEAESARQVQQHLGLSGPAAQAAAAMLVRRSTADPEQAERCLHQLVNWVSMVSGQLVEVQDMIDALLPRLGEAAAERGRAGSAVANELALARCAALRRRRCAHLGCTNVRLLLGAGPGSGDEQPKSYKCSGCHAVRFCSSACSRADWRVHKLACRPLAAARAAEAAGAAGGEQEA